MTTAQDLDGIVGRRFVYTYANGWQYEMYVKNATTIDYRIHSGMVGGRWVKDQEVRVVRIVGETYHVTWTEPTGTSVAVVAMLDQRRVHGVIFFPQWVHQHPERTVCFQNDHLDEMARYREQGPAHPVVVVEEFAEMTLLEHVGADDESVVAVGPGDLPAGWAQRRG